MNNKIFINGKIYTMDSDDNIADAIYVEGNLIKKIGSNEDILSIKKHRDQIIDLQGHTVVPGFNDSHMHLLMYGQSLNEVNLSNVKSQDEVIRLGRDFLKTHTLGKNKWLIGAGWNHEEFNNKEMLNRYDLDKISTEVPILFSRACYHIVACNTKALEIAGISANTHVDGGEVEVKNNEVTGVLKECAANIIHTIIGEMNRQEKKNAILEGMKKLSSFGVTSIHSDDFGDGGYEIIDIYKEIESDGKMDVRVYQQCRFVGVVEFNDFLNSVYNNHIGSESYKLGSVKILADGSLGGRTAYMNEPYSDDNTTCGISMFTQKELTNLIKAAHDNNLAVAIHAIGDKTIEMAIEGIVEAQRNNPKDNIRHGIVHCQLTNKESIEEFKKNNIIAFIQPIFIASDYKIVEKRIGKRRMEYSYNWKKLLENDVFIPLGTDTPVETPNPYQNIYCAVTRTDFEGKPEGGWMPAQKLSVRESLKGYTYDSAYASHEEKIKGTLEVGKYADMAVLSENIFEIDLMKIKDIYCIMTIKDGEIVYKQ